jgi:hypothetical protein
MSCSRWLGGIKSCKSADDQVRPIAVRPMPRSVVFLDFLIELGVWRRRRGGVGDYAAGRAHVGQMQDLDISSHLFHHSFHHSFPSHALSGFASWTVIHGSDAQAKMSICARMVPNIGREPMRDEGPLEDLFILSA